MMIPIIDITLRLPLGDEQRQRDAKERQRQRQHDRQRLQERPEQRCKDQVDEDHGEQNRLEHVALRLLEVLHVAAEHGVIARGQADLRDLVASRVRDVTHVVAA
jgi:hypothetical protein